MRLGRKKIVNFIYAGELKTRFNVFGHFYDLRLGGKVLKCRSTLDIVAADISDCSTMLPDAVVIMMNPGSSRPLDRKYMPKPYTFNEIFTGRWKKESVPAYPGRRGPSHPLRATACAC